MTIQKLGPPQVQQGLRDLIAQPILLLKQPQKMPRKLPFNLDLNLLK
jgi:hypothetical protein